MATLQSTAVTNTGATIASNTIFHAGNDGHSSGLNVASLWGYDLRYLDVNRRLTSLDLTGTTGNTNYNLTTFYPMLFANTGFAPGPTSNTNQWGSGVSALHIRRTNVHQEGGGFGSLFGRLRYRSSQWGHHQAFWELTENWGNGSYYPFIAGAAMTGQTNLTAVYLRGGLSYWYRFDSPDEFGDTSSTSPKPFPEYSNTAVTISTITATQIPGNSRYYAQGVTVKSGFNFGDPNFRWNTVYATAENASSDVRMKENFGIVLGTEFLKLLEPVSYQRVGNPDRRRAHGFIAQQVQDAMHKLGLGDDDFGGFDDASKEKLALRYGEFVAVLTKSLQEKRARVKTLIEKITKLEGTA